MCGYENRFGAFRPCFVDNAVEKRQYEEKLSVYQAAVLQEISSRTIAAPDFSREACLEAIIDLSMTPSPHEAAILGDLIHFDAMEHRGDGLPIAPGLGPDASVERVHAGFEQSYWKTGFLVRNRLRPLEHGLTPLDEEPVRLSTEAAADAAGLPTPDAPQATSAKTHARRAPLRMVVVSTTSPAQAPPF